MTKKIDFESQTAGFTTQFCYLPVTLGKFSNLPVLICKMGTISHLPMR